MRKPEPSDADDDKGDGSPLDHHPDSQNTRRDEHRIGDGADRDDDGDDPQAPRDTEAQNVGVLRTDRDDQGKPGSEPVERGQQR